MKYIQINILGVGGAGTDGWPSTTLPLSEPHSQLRDTDKGQGLISLSSDYIANIR